MHLLSGKGTGNHSANGPALRQYGVAFVQQETLQQPITISATSTCLVLQSCLRVMAILRSLAATYRGCCLGKLTSKKKLLRPQTDSNKLPKKPSLQAISSLRQTRLYNLTLSGSRGMPEPLQRSSSKGSLSQTLSTRGVTSSLFRHIGDLRDLQLTGLALWS